MLAFLLGIVPLAQNAAATTPEQVKEFVHNIYIEGVPYDEASQLAADVALPVLKQVLDDPGEDEYWANAAITIGMIGNDQGVNLLTEFVNRQEAKSKLTRAQTVAKTSAVIALGYIVNKTGNREALDFLIKGVDPATWKNRNLMWTGEFHADNSERDKQLATMAVLGLGVSGNADAAKTLRSLKAAPKTAQMRALKKAMPGLGSVADEALKANSAISSRGLKNYYLKSRIKQAPGAGGADIRSISELETEKPPVAGEVLKEPQAGIVLRNPQPGEVLSPPKEGKVLRPLQAGEIINLK